LTATYFEALAGRHGSCSFNVVEPHWDGDDLVIDDPERPGAARMRLRWVDLAAGVAEVEACDHRGFYALDPSLPEVEPCGTGPCIDPAWYVHPGDYTATIDVVTHRYRWCSLPGAANGLHLYDDRVELDGCSFAIDAVRTTGRETTAEGRSADGTAARITVGEAGYGNLSVWACGRWSHYNPGPAAQFACFGAPGPVAPEDRRFDLTLDAIAGHYEPVASVDGTWKIAGDCGGLVRYDPWEEGPVAGPVTIHDGAVAHARSSFGVDHTELEGDTLVGFTELGDDAQTVLRTLTFRWIDREVPIAEINGRPYTTALGLDRDHTLCP
ncbi:MAG: hypothetical protein ABMB14_34215, partial [Myxococcota bacterium]